MTRALPEALQALHLLTWWIANIVSNEQQIIFYYTQKM